MRDLSIEEYGVPPLSETETELVRVINTTWSHQKALSELKSHLQVAVEIELATIPVYLYAYYSINRTPKHFPDTDVSRFADKAGALVMSVAVEEMLHMSLSANILFSLGQMPELYQKSPGPYPTNLPGHEKLGPNAKPLQIPLAKFSSEQLWKFLEIEYPENIDAKPEGADWHTIGQIYSYVRCIISSDLINDDCFKVGATNYQVQPSNYSPNSIDTVYPEGPFKKKTPVPPSQKQSAADVAKYTSQEDSHTGNSALINISDRKDALQAIATICFQGEGFDHTKIDDPSAQELSHYYKFLTLQSELKGYPESPTGEPLPPLPAPPAAAAQQFSQDDLSSFVYNFPSNPVSANYDDEQHRLVVDVASGLYQYMLILTETIFLIPQDDNQQKIFFNRALHNSMIWLLDKYCQTLRTIPQSWGDAVLSPTFENIDLGTRENAFANLSSLCNKTTKVCANTDWYKNAGLDYYLNKIKLLPDVTDYWKKSKYAGAPSFPTNPPATIPSGADRHACMGLNECKNQGRTLANDCAGQGSCSTSLAYNPADENTPNITDHTCHVLNDCAGQGGCGLYGTADEQNNPGGNECRSLGSCATPINAERFSTDGPNQGKSVWSRAREVFTTEVWPELKKTNPKLPDTPPQVPGTNKQPDLFKYGPSIEWIEHEGGGMTACGASGMSGAGSCS
ncbi:hypothetical protein MNBD_GAMMA07-1986 [hydrothermal vent metagenome]|uniref:Iminophenyl-pyruvate dimer synthase domain-containing protein n=2 Tax=hydrothermal vent metagenome TaxID=652676 RepID=A0A3B0XGQ6_9ZZZZ